MRQVRAVHIVSALLCSLVLFPAQGRDRATPVGLALEVDNGAGLPLAVKAGQTFYVNQIDLRAAVTAGSDEGVDGLDRSGDFASLDWQGVRKDDQEFVLLANPDGTFRRRRFFRDARWMNGASSFTLEQLDRDGRVLGPAVTVSAGTERKRRESDDFFVRRIRAIQWTNDCRTPSDCSSATSFEEEALVELRYAMHPERTFTIAPRATALRLHWSLRPAAPYVIPLHAGRLAAVRLRVLDRCRGRHSAAGRRQLRARQRHHVSHHAAATAPANAFTRRARCRPTTRSSFGPNPAGIQYYRAFFDPTTTYWRRKHRERMLMAEFIGPAQSAQPIRSDHRSRQVPQRGRRADHRHARAGRRPRRVPHVSDGARPVRRRVRSGTCRMGRAGARHVDASHPRGRAGRDVLPERQGTADLSGRGHSVLADGRDPGRFADAARSTRCTTGPCTTCHRGPSSLGKVLHAQRRPRNLRRLPRAARVRARRSDLRPHALHSLALQSATARPLTQCSSCHLTRRASSAPASRPACRATSRIRIARARVRADRKHVRRRRPRVVSSSAPRPAIARIPAASSRHRRRRTMPRETNSRSAQRGGRAALRQIAQQPIYNRTLRKEVGRGELDYEVYLRTRELLALQTPAEPAGRARRAAVPGHAPDAGAVAQVRRVRGDDPGRGPRRRAAVRCARARSTASSR